MRHRRENSRTRRMGLAAILVMAASVPVAMGQTGACCLDGIGTCEVLTQAACAGAGGVFRGNGTDCATIVCQRYVKTLLGSGSAAGIGQFLDIMPESSILINAIDYHVTTASGAGAPLILDVWVHDGTYREAEVFDPEKWTLHETLNGTSVGGGATVPVHVTLSNPILVQAGRTKALFLHTRLGTMHFRTNTERNPTLHTNGEVTLYSERYRFGTGGGGWSGNLTTARDFMGGIYYIPADEAVTGACCLPAGGCDAMTLGACTASDGVFRQGADCASMTCEPRAACCFRDGLCLEMLREDCTGRYTGQWHGAGIGCPAVTCNVPGACCFAAAPAGGCVVLMADECIAAGGTFLGALTTCAQDGPKHCWSPPILWHNGPLATGDVVGGQPAPPGTVFSEVQQGNVLHGANVYRNVLNIPGGFTVADRFEVVSPGGWRIDDITVYTYREINPNTAPGDITSAYLEIWDGPPGSPGASVVFGDQTTDRRISAELAGIYRVLNGVYTENRRIRAVRMAVDTVLGPGEYWLRYSVIGDGNFSFATKVPFVTIPGVRGPIGAGAIQTLGTHVYPLLDDVNLPLVPQQLPFVIRGEVLASECYANCDGSTVAPVLNIDDFTCFINEFATGLALPPAQQVTAYANCDGSTTQPVLNIDDFTCFINAFAHGCP